MGRHSIGTPWVSAFVTVRRPAWVTTADARGSRGVSHVVQRSDATYRLGGELVGDGADRAPSLTRWRVLRRLYRGAVRGAAAPPCRASRHPDPSSPAAPRPRGRRGKRGQRHTRAAASERRDPGCIPNPRILRAGGESRRLRARPLSDGAYAGLTKPTPSTRRRRTPRTGNERLRRGRLRRANSRSGGHSEGFLLPTATGSPRTSDVGGDGEAVPPTMSRRGHARAPWGLE